MNIRYVFLCITALLFCTLSAQKLTIESMKGMESIRIGNKTCKKNSKFDSHDVIQWTDNGQMLWVSEDGTAHLYLLTSESLASVGCKTAFDYIHKNDKNKSSVTGTKKMSTRDLENDCFSQRLNKVTSYDDTRIALLIGNSNYLAENSLYNPVADVLALSQKFTQLGFNVYVCFDADLKTINEAVNRFAALATGYNTALVYYAGHGVQFKDDTYLLPVDAVIETTSDITDEKRTFAAGRIVSFLNDVENLSTRLFFIDACRSEKRNLLASRGDFDQLLKTKELNEGVILYSTQSGNVAFDVSYAANDHSPFATSLLSRLDIENMSINDLITDVRNDVVSATSDFGSPQSPREISTLSHRFYFKSSSNMSTLSPKQSLTFAEGKYVGDTKDKKRHGFGTFTYANGVQYIGEWKDDTPDGQGTLTIPDGTKYVGEWKNGSLNGHGTYIWPDGKKFVGEFKNGPIDGVGTMTWPNGDQYIGEWKDDKMSGQGTYTRPDGYKYVGEWKDMKRNGQGTASWPNGEKYIGEWIDDSRNGQGSMVFYNGNQYIGDFKDDKMDGQGTLTGVGEFEGYKYVGEWKKGTYNGYGTMFIPDGKCVGTWIMGIIEDATIYYNDGRSEKAPKGKIKWQKKGERKK